MKWVNQVGKITNIKGLNNLLFNKNETEFSKLMRRVCRIFIHRHYNKWLYNSFVKNKPSFMKVRIDFLRILNRPDGFVISRLKQ